MSLETRKRCDFCPTHPNFSATFLRLFLAISAEKPTILFVASDLKTQRFFCDCDFLGTLRLSANWWRMQWPFSRARKNFRVRILQDIPKLQQKERFFARRQAPNFESSEPEKMQFRTPQEPRKGGFSERSKRFCRIQCRAQEDKRYPSTVGPTIITLH